MSANVITIDVKGTNVNRKVRVKGIALPNEHGAWGFLFEPLVAGLAIAFSLAAPWIALLVIGAFLTRQPLKILLADWLAGRNLPQTTVALKFTIIYLSVAAVGLIGLLAFAELSVFVPFMLVAPFAVYQIYCDATRKSRQLWAELTGAVAISSSIAVIALAGGWSWAGALGLWGIFIARVIPSILYVRNRLKLEKGKSYSWFSVFGSNLLAVFGIICLAFYGLAPNLTVAVIAFLFVRALIGISPYRRKIKAMKIGVYEVIYGTLTVLTVILGYYLNI